MFTFGFFHFVCISFIDDPFDFVRSQHYRSLHLSILFIIPIYFVHYTYLFCSLYLSILFIIPIYFVRFLAERLFSKIIAFKKVCFIKSFFSIKTYRFFKIFWKFRSFHRLQDNLFVIKNDDVLMRLTLRVSTPLPYQEYGFFWK